MSRKIKVNDCHNCVFGDMWEERFSDIRCDRIPSAKIAWNTQEYCKYHCRAEVPTSWRLKMKDELEKGGYVKD